MEAFDVEPVYKSKPAMVEYDGPIPDAGDEVVPWMDERDMILGDGNDCFRIKCPWYEEHTDGKEEATYFPLTVGDRPAQRGFSCLHSHCKDRTTKDFLNWVIEQGGPDCEVSAVPEFELFRLREIIKERPLTEDERTLFIDYSQPPLRRLDLPDCDYVKANADGSPNAAKAQGATGPNLRYIVKESKIKLRFNIMTRKAEVTFLDPELEAIIAEGDSAASDEGMQIIRDACERLGIKKDKYIDQAIDLLAMRSSYHPMLEWLETLEWDGKDRWPELYATLEVPEEYEAIKKIYLRKFMLQIAQGVGGWRKPQQISSVLVLSGEQNIYKTTLLKHLVPAGYFMEGASMDLKSNATTARDSISKVTMRALTELGELETTFGKADAGALKAFLSDTEDIYRKSYGHGEIANPRCTAFCGSVNLDTFLVDPTGSRRFWALKVTACHSRAEIFKDEEQFQQLWAQIHHEWKHGADWRLTDEEDEIRADQADAFRLISDAEELATQYFHDHEATKEDKGTPMNQTMFCKRLDIKPSNQNLAAVRKVLNGKLGGSRRSIQNVQNAWMVPTKLTNPSATYMKLSGIAAKRERNVKSKISRINAKPDEKDK